MKINQKGRKRHDTLLREKFGIGLYQYEELLLKQNGKCFICNDKEERNLAVDHNHTTGEVRRLLCGACNMALGLFREDPHLLRKAAVYVESTFDLPEDRLIEAKPHVERARWRNIVTTPNGVFDSFEAAGKHYGVHPTTVGCWCGAYRQKLHLKKDEFKYERVFK